MSAESEKEPMKFLRMKQVMELTGLSRTGVYLSVERGEFPQPIKLGCKAIAWVESEVNAWMKDRAENHRAPIRCAGTGRVVRQGNGQPC